MPHMPQLHTKNAHIVKIGELDLIATSNHIYLVYLPGSSVDAS